MITSNIIQRVYQVKFGNSFGTGFSINRKGKEFIVSAKHIFDGLEEGPGIIEISHLDKWLQVPVKKISCADLIDIVIFEWESPLKNAGEIELGGHYYASQDAYFLGYPFGFRTDGGGGNSGYPIPFIKKSIVSGFDLKTPKTIFLDGHNNKGFSGGPVVTIEREKMNIIGVVSGYFYDNDAEKLGKGINENSGIFYAHNISHALELIDNLYL